MHPATSKSKFQSGAGICDAGTGQYYDDEWEVVFQSGAGICDAGTKVVEQHLL